MAITKPTVGGSYDSWGDELNALFDDLRLDSTSYSNWVLTAGRDAIFETLKVQLDATVKTDLAVEGNFFVDSDGDGNWSFIYFRGITTYLGWDNANSRFQFNSSLYVNDDYIWLGTVAEGDCYIGFWDNGGAHTITWKSIGYFLIGGPNSLRTTAKEFWINEDYTSGDVDCYIFFNDTQESIMFDYGNDWFKFTKGLYVTGGVWMEGDAIIEGGLKVTADSTAKANFAVEGNLFVNKDYQGGDEDSYILFNGISANLQWDDGFNFFKFSAPLYVTGGFQATGGNIQAGLDVWANEDIYVNYDYVSGDEDATLWFNAETEWLKFNWGMNRFELSADLLVIGKVDSTGGVDPPYVLYDNESREAVVDRINKEVFGHKREGAVMFYNGALDQMELYFPKTGKFKRLLVEDA